jgi:hypothetical protein
VLADRVTQVFYVIDSEIRKHVVVSEKKKIIGVENVKDNDEDINQFEKMSLFSNPMNIKHIEKDFDKKLMPYMRKGGNGKSICEKVAMKNLYENYVSHFILMLVFVCMDLNLSYII